MLKHPDSDKIMRNVGNLIGDGRRMEEEHRHIEVVNSLKAEYDMLLPRWKGVSWTAEAKLQASLVIGHGIGGKYIPIMARLAKARRWSKR